jgi:DNA-binding transcriptional ArsR family regulator
MSEYPIPDAEITITNPETLKVIADSLRLQILKQLKQPATVKEVGDNLDIVPTKLYYHFSQLEKHGLIRVVETNIVSGIVEKQYQVTARRYRVDDQLLATPEDAAEHIDSLLGAVFDNAKIEIKKSVDAGLMVLGKDIPCEQGTLVQTGIFPNEQQLADFCTRLEALLEECEEWSEAEPDKSKQPYGLLLAFYPIVRTEKANSDE